MNDSEVEKPLPSTLNPWQGLHEEIFHDISPELDVEGSRMCAKTTLLLSKEIHYLQKYAGIHTLICRYTDKATTTKLIPRFEALARILGLDCSDWDAKELCYNFPNGSKCYAFGLKSQNQAQRYEKIRGLDVSRVYNDQTEELPRDIGEELRASLRQKGFPHQLTFSPNPPGTNHWLADARHGGFPTDNSVKGRKYYRLKLRDNAYNLNIADIELLERTFPPDHAKHGPMILGQRGINVIGESVFEDTFKRLLHVRALVIDPNIPLLEGFDFGKFNNVWCVAQRQHSGGLALLAGIIGENLFLEEFLPTVQEYREDWFGHFGIPFKTCCPPPAPAPNNGTRFTNLAILARNGFKPHYRDNANAADVRLALIEQLAGYMRRRNASGDEAFGISDDASRWMKFSHAGLEPWPFMAQAFEAGIVWDEHLRSVSNNAVRQVRDDDWFGNVARAVSNIELNFCANRPTEAEREAKAAATKQTISAGLPAGALSTYGWMC